MGRQLRLVQFDADAVTLGEELIRRGFVLLAYYQAQGGLVHIPALSREDYGQPMAWAALASETGLISVAARGSERWLIESIHSPVIEIAFGGGTSQPTPGRLFYQPGRWVDREWRPWSDDFNDGASSLFGWVRRTYHRGAHGTWYSADAWQWHLSSEGEAANGLG